MSETKVSTNEDFIRPPVVTVMGHVDHGKTSILDAIRHTNVQSKEYGGITQHIGAYQIVHNLHKITFIDTPGHAAFMKMRARGGRAADIVVLVVAADEGVKPQTKEAIYHARAANTSIIVALNKIDLPGADPQKVKQELAQENILVEDWGGDILCIEVSAKSGKNLDKLLDAILAVAEISNLKANPTGELEAVIIESKLDRKRGTVVSCIVKNGTLKVGDKVVASGYEAVVRSLMDDKGIILKEAPPSTPVEVLGFKETPNVGDLLVEKGSELEQLAVDESRVEIVGKNTKKMVGIIIRADSQGTLEAVKESLANLVTSSVGQSYSLKFLRCSTGDITDSDVMLASSANGVIVGFSVKLSSEIEDFAEEFKVQVKTYKTIYELIDDTKDLLEGTATEAEAKIKGRARVIKIFKLSSGDLIAGSKVIAGALKVESRISIYDKDPNDLTKEDIPLYTGIIRKLKKGKDEVKMVGKDNECGVLLKPQYNEIAEGMWIESR
ncbi:translation initiation factor IF-2 [candidate division WWE3 bacterium RIFCSPHIGHO2_12_FULL_38_15]|uniref:Translation initiation factor IF-2 n=1 Tax=candidate division WWE3 bacterium RIFCSPHIGHO2_02_FULL_38_14 TaxID=1802620 RepID=A0A1F4VB18_UNCKA|nr:MAG: translation initiation factor IF-2 [candidate division WWE3 bacterium RIFCSPHIGHO2_01_FULL_38_45]OGC49037.1 MAG: translation initiation factor IF-2 [candidate division WWE3 bacterium RIFCSPHIGHO2_12_FULL_38_15]OGC53492.1 MAG: translation initiation factor IF-2 [candidate division WWE3 bacterium RIFCSPLOWO2_01_FULL_37_24]OGC54396.1 MAG: translation initiation factor IF-2 [candidate division WWE3 bacterium RIFCSPHIGHO2_02_FULL_38_14]HLB51640.1 translation initiation factor IF-2 [Patesciba